MLPGGLKFPLPLNGNAKYAMELNSTRYTQINSRVPVFTLGPENGGGYFGFPIDLIIKLSNVPSSGLAIKAGEVIAELHMEKCAVHIGKGDACIDVNQFKWYVRSATDVYIKTNTCDVNNGEAINVDFGHLDKTKLRDDPFAAWPRITKKITVACKKAGGGLANFTGPAGVQLRTTASSFNSSLIQTDLGGRTDMMATAMLDGDKIIGPYKQLNVQLEKGIGDKDISFAVVKNPAMTHSQMSDGAFVANAVLVVTSP
jgi:hypothetical protein